VVLDEVTYPVNWEWIDVGRRRRDDPTRPDHVNLVITGRDAPQALIDLADTVTEMAETKHAYQAGISAKKGIDF
jgi:cob(I)alamin adenosyltransferase